MSGIRVVVWPGRLKTYQPFYDDLISCGAMLEHGPASGDILVGPFRTVSNPTNGKDESLWLVRGRFLWTNARLMEGR